ncbi:MAG: alpha/beta fold hydrolase [Syntrophobacteraceae bacterium]
MENGRPFRIGPDGISLSAVVHLPAKVPAPVIVCCHGLLSLKDSPKYVAIGKQMSAAGFCVLRFDFSGCGDSPLRKETLIGARRRDLDAVLDFSRVQPWSDGRIGLLGSSLGGYLAILAANEDPDRIRAVASWAAPFDISRLDPAESGMDELGRLVPGGFRLGEPQNLSSAGGAERVLLIHGREDEVVPWEHSVEIYRRIKDPKELVLMRTADHRLVDESWRQAAIRMSLDWFLRFF